MTMRPDEREVIARAVEWLNRYGGPTGRLRGQELEALLDPAPTDQGAGTQTSEGTEATAPESSLQAESEVGLPARGEAAPGPAAHQPSGETVADQRAEGLVRVELTREEAAKVAAILGYQARPSGNVSEMVKEIIRPVVERLDTALADEGETE